MANQGYLGRKTHPARATNKAGALFFSRLSALLCVCLSVRLSVCRSLCLCVSSSVRFYCRLCTQAGKLLSQGDTKVQRAWLPHYGIKAVSSANTTHSKKNTHTHVRVWAGAMCVQSQMCAID